MRSWGGGGVLVWSVSPGFWEFGERCQAAGVHVTPHVDVDGGIGLGELGGGGDALGGHRRDGRAAHGQPGHAPPLL